MKILAVGDIVGENGLDKLKQVLPKLKEEAKIDFIVVNAENVAGGMGITFENWNELLKLPIDAFTMGNHTWAKKDIFQFINHPKLIRPANYSKGIPGKGYGIYKCKEKNIAVMRHFLDGKINVLFGTHTHVQTADEQITEKGTAYITDLGMTGPINSVIGMGVEESVKRFVTSLPERYKLADGNCMLNGCIFEINDENCKTEKIERIIVK